MCLGTIYVSLTLFPTFFDRLDMFAKSVSIKISFKVQNAAPFRANALLSSPYIFRVVAIPLYRGILFI
jgi:hypothetical protein